MKNSSIEKWIYQEFRDINLGDIRLNNRFMEISKGFANNSEKNISSTFDNWKDIKACYRFFSNDKVSSSQHFMSPCPQNLRKSTPDGNLLVQKKSSINC